MTTELTPVGNPQGKGLSGIINDFHNSTPINNTAKPHHQWLADYFTSILVLNAECGLKPIVNKTYYLYLKNNIWKLSLIEPGAWSPDISGVYFAKCSLHKDRTWVVSPKSHWQKNKTLLATIQQLQNDFLSSIKNDRPIIEQLPFFAAHLPYYRRISANALARSLKQSLALECGKYPSGQLTGENLLEQVASTKTNLLTP